MYAVIESGGKQYKVEEGTSLFVDRLDAKDGDKIALRLVLFRDGDVIVGAKDLAKVKVEAKVAGHLRGKKIKVFKYKAKKGYRKRAGHRSELTKLEVTSLKGGKKARWPIRKVSVRPATGANPIRTCWASRSSPASRSTGGEIIVRQRGTRFWPGEGVGLAGDHTIFATARGQGLLPEPGQGPHDQRPRRRLSSSF